MALVAGVLAAPVLAAAVAFAAPDTIAGPALVIAFGVVVVVLGLRPRLRPVALGVAVGGALTMAAVLWVLSTLR